MFVQVNGARLFFDVDGPKLTAEGDRMRERPTLLLLHGGPGFDHTSFKPGFAALTDTAQVVYLDQRGQGRSTGGAGSDPDTWTLAQWADDVKGFCDALGIERPVVLGNSFGGFVAQAYMQRHPDHAAGVILSSTAARMRLDVVLNGFERRGGPRVRDAAEAFWTDVTTDKMPAYQAACMPYYTTTHAHLPGSGRAIIRAEVLAHFSGRQGEMWRMDFRDALRSARVPTLLLAGDHDPVTPWEVTAEILDHLPPGIGRMKRFPTCGHGVFRDDPDEAFETIRTFIGEVA